MTRIQSRYRLALTVGLAVIVVLSAATILTGAAAGVQDDSDTGTTSFAVEAADELENDDDPEDGSNETDLDDGADDEDDALQTLTVTVPDYEGDADDLEVAIAGPETDEVQTGDEVEFDVESGTYEVLVIDRSVADGERRATKSIYVTYNQTIELDLERHVSLGNGDLVWANQTAFVSAYAPGTEVNLRSGTPDDDGEFIEELSADSHGFVYFDLDGFHGDYYLDDGQTVVWFETSQQDIRTFTLDPERVTQGENVTMEIDSNRATFDVELWSDDLDGEDLADAIEDAEYDEASEAAVIENAGGTYSIATDALDAVNTTIELETVDTRAGATDDLAIRELGSATVTLDESVTQQTRGDVAEIGFSVENTDEAEFQIGDTSVNYVVNGTATPDENGTVTLAFDTLLAGQDEADVVTADDGTVTIDHEDNLGQFTLQDGAYRVEVRAGDDRDRGTLLIEDRWTDENATTHVLPADERPSDAEDILEYATEHDEVAAGDRIVVEVETTGVSNYLADEDALTANDSWLSFEISEADPGPHAEPVTFDGDEDAIDVIDYSDGDRVFFVLDPEALGGNESSLDVGTTYDAALRISDDAPHIEENETATASFVVVDREITFEENRLEVSAETDRVVSGATTLAPGTELRVEVDNPGEEPFVDWAIAEVRDDGGFVWDATFGDVFDGVAVNTTFDVIVTGPDVEAEGEGIVVELTDEQPSLAPTETPDESTTETPDESTTETPTDDADGGPAETDTESTDETDEDSPGFGIAVAVLTLLGVVLLAARRGS